MATWTAEDLATIGDADELDIAPDRGDGMPGAFTTIWVVRVGEQLYVRSWRGRGCTWFTRALQEHAGRVRTGDVQRDVTFDEATNAGRDAIDRAYRTKYGKYGGRYVDPMVSPDAATATLRLVPR